MYEKTHTNLSNQTFVSQTLLGKPKGSVELGNPNTNPEKKLCLFFIYFGSRIVCRETEVFNTQLVPAKFELIS